MQGEIEEVLNNISLSVNILRELYRAYDFCCANMELFFKVRPAARGVEPGRGGAAVCPGVGACEDLRGPRPVPSPLLLLQKDKEPVPWEFPSSLAFSRMNAFFRRVRTVEVKSARCRRPHSAAVPSTPAPPPHTQDVGDPRDWSPPLCAPSCQLGANGTRAGGLALCHAFGVRAGWPQRRLRGDLAEPGGAAAVQGGGLGAGQGGSALGFVVSVGAFLTWCTCCSRH